MSYALYPDISDVVFSIPVYTVLHVVIWKLTRGKSDLLLNISSLASQERENASFLYLSRILSGTEKCYKVFTLPFLHFSQVSQQDSWPVLN